MFEKTVINALTSPELVGELRAYNRQLKGRFRQFRITTIFIAIFIVLQYVGLAYSPGNPVASSSDTIYGGASNSRSLMATYDDPHSDFRKVAKRLGISAENLRHMSTNNTSLRFDHPMIIWSPSPTYNPVLNRDAESSPTFSLKAGDTIYYGYALNTHTYQLPAKTGWIITKPNAVIVKQTGNIITSWENAQKASFCYKTPQMLSLSYIHCPNGQSVRTSLEAKNPSLKTDAAFIKSSPSDTIEYSLTTKNTSNTSVTLSPRISVDDILEYTTLENYSGATFSEKEKTLEWPPVTIAANDAATRSFVVKVKNHIPLVAQGSDNANSYDCWLSSYYGMSQSIALRCPPVKIVERLLHFPPNMTFLIVCWLGLLVSSYLYARNALLYKESLYILRYLRRKHE